LKNKIFLLALCLLAVAVLCVGLVSCGKTVPSVSPSLSPSPSPSPSSSPTPTIGGSITAFVASSGKVALQEAAQVFTAKTGVQVFLTVGGSGSLLSQLELGKTGDIFLPASPDYVDKAVAAGVINPGTDVKINYLVPAILVQKGNPLHISGLSDLARPGVKVAICDPATVPAGLFAYEILEYNNVIHVVGDNIVTYSTSNENVSSLVILKTVDAAIAWDVVGVQQPDKLDIVYLQPNQVPRLSYMSGAVTTFTTNKQAAQAFLDFLVSPDGQAIFKKNGYYTTEAEARKFAPNAMIGGTYQLPADYQPLVK
jgi:molybdate transport system substrate-binding protein